MWRSCVAVLGTSKQSGPCKCHQPWFNLMRASVLMPLEDKGRPFSHVTRLYLQCRAVTGQKKGSKPGDTHIFFPPQCDAHARFFFLSRLRNGRKRAIKSQHQITEACKLLYRSNSEGGKKALSSRFDRMRISGVFGDPRLQF